MADIVRRDPFVGSLRQAMENFFDDGFFREPFAGFPFRFISDEGSLPLDMYEKDGKLIVEASLPGFAKNEIDIQVHDGVLAIKAQHAEEKEEKGEGKYYRRERSWSAVSRRVALPGLVDQANVEATLKDGVLTLAIPQPAKPQPKQIEIKG